MDILILKNIFFTIYDLKYYTNANKCVISNNIVYEIFDLLLYNRYYYNTIKDSTWKTIIYLIFFIIIVLIHNLPYLLIYYTSDTKINNFCLCKYCNKYIYERLHTSTINYNCAYNI